jgi:hypothetical protein
MSGLTKYQAFAYCQEMQHAFFRLADAAESDADKRFFQSQAVKAGSVAGYVMPPTPPPGPIAQAIGPLSGLSGALKAYPPPSVSGFRPRKSGDEGAA